MKKALHRHRLRAWIFGGSLLACLLVPWVLRAIDEDGDGMSDLWQAQHVVATGDTDSDPDNDLFPNWMEARSGPIPTTTAPPPTTTTLTACRPWSAEPPIP